VKVSPACGKKSSGRVTSAGRALRLPELLSWRTWPDRPREIAWTRHEPSVSVSTGASAGRPFAPVTCGWASVDVHGCTVPSLPAELRGRSRSDTPRAHHGIACEDVHRRARQC
jgi:hypothetical protein